MKVAIISLMDNTSVHCLNNDAQLNYLEKLLNDNNIELAKDLKEADYVIYASCAFSGESINEFDKTINDLLILQEEYDYKLIIAGCITKLYNFENINSNIKIIFNPIWSKEIINYLKNEEKTITIEDKILSHIKSYSPKDINFSIDIQSGCTNKCSFCKENYLNNKIESLPYDELLSFLKKKIKNGTRIIDFHGECLNLYGLDSGERILHKLLHELDKENDLLYINISEITVQNMYNELLNEIIHNSKLSCVGLQLESASNELLKKMNRNHTIDDYYDIAKSITSSGKLIDTVLMTGYPDEKYSDLDKTIKFIEDNNLVVTAVAEYDDFEYLPSHNLKQLSKTEKKKHTRYLKEQIIPLYHKFYEQNIDRMENAVIHDKIDNIILTSSRTKKFAYTTKKEFQDLELGSIIKEPPRRYVKSSKYFSINNSMYKY